MTQAVVARSPSTLRTNEKRVGRERTATARACQNQERRGRGRLNLHGSPLCTSRRTADIQHVRQRELLTMSKEMVLMRWAAKPLEDHPEDDRPKSTQMKGHKTSPKHKSQSGGILRWGTDQPRTKLPRIRSSRRGGRQGLTTITREPRRSRKPTSEGREGGEQPGGEATGRSA